MNFHYVRPVNSTSSALLLSCRETSWIPTIAIPARNEAARLPFLIRSLSKQTWLNVRGRKLHVTIALNNCDDDSEDVAHRESSFHAGLSVELVNVKFPEHQAHVGSARRLAAECALAKSANDHTVLLTTDADGVPEPRWVENNLRAIENGADAVGGFISADESEVAQLAPNVRRRAALHLYYAKLADQLTALLDPLDYDPWPRHQDHTGASLAVRADVYHQVGGIPRLAYREDIAFVERVRSAGFRLRHALDVRVKVSARLDGRAENGMSTCLQRWTKAERDREPHLVEPPKAILERILQAKSRTDFKGNPCAVDARTIAPTGIGSADSPDVSETDPSATIPVELAIAQIEWMISNVDQYKIARTISCPVERDDCNSGGSVRR
jgi:Glycosyl transferase family 2